MKTAIVFLISYLLGCIPWALIIVKLIGKKDVRQEGTGNVGAMNSYDITGKSYVFALVLLLDGVKGALAVMISYKLLGADFWLITTAALFAITGHIYNVFLGFRGGRGLATGLGALLLLNPPVVLSWIALWFVCYYFVRKNVHIANLFALVLAPTLFITFHYDLIYSLLFFPAPSKYNYYAQFMAFCTLAIFNHIRPAKEYLSSATT